MLAARRRPRTRAMRARLRGWFEPCSTSHEGLIPLGTGGPLFGSAVRAIVYVSWAAVLPYFLLACADSLQGLVPGLQMVTWQWALVVAALLFPALQLRTFHQVRDRARARVRATATATATARARARARARAVVLGLGE